MRQSKRRDVVTADEFEEMLKSLSTPHAMERLDLWDRPVDGSAAGTLALSHVDVLLVRPDGADAGEVASEGDEVSQSNDTPDGPGCLVAEGTVRGSTAEWLLVRVRWGMFVAKPFHQVRLRAANANAPTELGWMPVRVITYDSRSLQGEPGIEF